MDTRPLLGIPWYTADTYAAAVSLFEDAAQMPRTYENWLQKAIAEEARQHLRGLRVVRAYIEPDTFPAFCILNNRKVAAECRTAWANLWVYEVRTGKRTLDG